MVAQVIQGEEARDIWNYWRVESEEEHMSLLCQGEYSAEMVSESIPLMAQIVQLRGMKQLNEQTSTWVT